MCQATRNLQELVTENEFEERTMIKCQFSIKVYDKRCGGPKDGFTGRATLNLHTDGWSGGVSAGRWEVHSRE